MRISHVRFRYSDTGIRQTEKGPVAKFHGGNGFATLSAVSELAANGILNFGDNTTVSQ